MVVRIPADVERKIQEKVAVGRYSDGDDVLRQALQALDERDRLHDLRASLARAKEDVARGDFVEWSPDFMDELIREADELSAQGYQPKPDVCP
jgi:putative addiction module CopG family antidote